MVFTVHLFQPLVHDARPAYVGKPCRAPVTVSIASLPSERRKVPLMHKMLYVFLFLGGGTVSAQRGPSSLAR